MSRNARLALVAGFIVVVVAAFVIAKSGSDSGKSSPTTASTPTTTTETTGSGTTTTIATPAKPAIPVVVVRNGKPVGGIKKLNYKVGDRVAFTVRSDVGDEIHVHGYDFHKDVKAGGAVSFSFPAKIDGIFVIELENHGQQIAELKVQP